MRYTRSHDATDFAFTMTLAMSDGSDAGGSIHFAQALAMFLFTLPAKVTRGLKESSLKPMKSKRQATDAGKTA